MCLYLYGPILLHAFTRWDLLFAPAVCFRILVFSSSYCFSRRQLADTNVLRSEVKAQQSTMQVDNELVQALTSVEGAAFSKCWAEFLFDTDKLQKVREAGQEALTAVVTSGMRYTGIGWTSSRASRTLYDLTGVGIVSADFKTYLWIWLFTITLLAEIGVPALELTAEQSEASFTLAASIDQPQQEKDAADDNSDEEVQLPWDEPTLPMPREVAEVWQRAESGRQRIDVKRLLERSPRYAGLPREAQRTIWKIGVRQGLTVF